MTHLENEIQKFEHIISEKNAAKLASEQSIEMNTETQLNNNTSIQKVIG